MSRFSRLIPRFLRGDKPKISSSKDSGYYHSGTTEKSKDGSACRILFLDDTDILLTFKGSSKASVLLERVFEHLNLVEKDYFGLRFLDQSDQTHWLDPQKALSSQLKTCSTPYTLYFGVKFYPPDPCKLKEEITRYQFFLQIKRDILQGRLPITFDEAAELFAFAVQSELGDYDPRSCYDGYISEFRFVPNQTVELEEKISRFHQHLVGLGPGQAEHRFLDKVKWLDMYGVDLHPVLGEGNTEYFLGLTPTGIVVYKNKTKVGNYFWPRITKVTFKGKIFIIKVRDKNNDEHTYAFEVATKTGTKHLWKCCVEHHSFFRLSQIADTIAISVKQSRQGSKRSGRNERQNNADLRQQPSVSRIPSRRQPMRSKSDSRLNGGKAGSYYSVINDAAVTRVVAPEPVKGFRNRSLPDLQRNQSPRSTRSAPWERDADAGLYTSGRESPVSLHSDVHKFPRRVGQTSDTESGGHRRKYFPKNKGSDNESDASFSRRRRRDGDSGSESDVSPMRNRRPKSTIEPWYENQWRDAVEGMFHQDKENHMNGSIPSIHSAPAGEVKRRRRRRTKSPGTTKRPPEELKQHIVYDLIDTEGMAPEDLQDIPYVKVETKAEPFKIKYSPHIRQRYRSPKRKGFGDLDPSKNQLPQSGEPPPPYTPTESPNRTPEIQHRNYMSDTNGYNYRSDIETQSMKSASTYRSSQNPGSAKYRNPHSRDGTPEQMFGQRVDSIRSQNRNSAGSTIQYKVQSNIEASNTSINNMDDAQGHNSESASSDTLEAVDQVSQIHVPMETEDEQRQAGQRYNGNSGYTSDVVSSRHQRNSGYMSDVTNNKARGYSSRQSASDKTNNSSQKPLHIDPSGQNPVKNDMSLVKERYMINPVSGVNNRSREREQIPDVESVHKHYSGPRSGSQIYQSRQSARERDHVSDVDYLPKKKNFESPSKQNNRFSSYPQSLSNASPHSTPPKSTPPSNNDFYLKNYSLPKKYNSTVTGQQNSLTNTPEEINKNREIRVNAALNQFPNRTTTPEKQRNRDLNFSDVNGSLNSSNMSSQYQASPYKQNTATSVRSGNVTQPSSDFSPSVNRSFSSQQAIKQLYSPPQFHNSSVNTTQENTSYSSQGRSPRRPRRDNISYRSPGGQENMSHEDQQRTPVRTNEYYYNDGRSPGRCAPENTPYVRSAPENMPYNRSAPQNMSYGRSPPENTPYNTPIGRFPGRTHKMDEDFSNFNGHVTVIGRTEQSSAQSSHNTSQSHSSWLGTQQSSIQTSPRKPYQTSARPGFSIPSHRGFSHSALDASVTHHHRSPHRRDLVTEI